MSLTITTTTKASAALTKTLDIAGDKGLPVTMGGETLTLANGSGANQASKVHTDSHQLAAAGTMDYDLDAGLLDVFGDSQTFTAVKLLYLRNTSATASIKVSGDFFGTNESPSIPAGGEYFFRLPSAAGMAVTASTGDVITITNEDGVNVADYQIMIAGI